MSLGTVLQTIIGTIFIYLILALITSEIQEQIAAFFEFRARNLKKSIQILLNEPAQKQKERVSCLQIVRELLLLVLFELGARLKIYSLMRYVLLELRCSRQKSLTELIYKNSQIASLNQSSNSKFKFFKRCLNWNLSEGPSYLTKEVFSQSLLDTLQDKLLDVNKLTQNEPIDSVIDKINTLQTMIYPETLKRLTEVANSAKLKNRFATLQELKIELEALFDKAQERTVGVYKRNAKGVSLIIGLIVAGISNADAFNIVSKLSQSSNNISSTIASQLTEKQQELQCPSNLSPEEYDKCVKDLSPKLKEFFETINGEIPLPLGWNFEERISHQDLNLKIKELNTKIMGEESLIPVLNKTIECFNLPAKEKQQGDQDVQLSKDKIDPQQAKDCYDNFLVELEQNSKVLLNSDDINDLGLKEYKKVTEDWNAYKKKLTNHKNELKEKQSSLRLEKIQVQVNNQNQSQSFNDIIKEQGGWYKVGFGWWVSAIAISMGAPFWFDLLGRVMNVRNAGKPSSPRASNSSSNSES